MTTAAADLPAPNLSSLVAGARSGSRRAIGRLFTEAERAASDGSRATALMAALTAAPLSGPAAGRVVGLTGAPGAGKSSLAAALSAALVSRGSRVAVLAVDPSSPITGGAVLGDRVRFSDTQPDRVTGLGDGSPVRLLVRSIASRGHAGGLARAVPLAIAVAGGVGFDDILVETVGSGQGEIAVAAAVDTTVLVVAPGQGDEVQALKAGIAELSDVICVNKSDLSGAAESARQWRAALAPPAPQRWDRQVVLASARTPDVTELMAALDARAAWLATAPPAAPRDGVSAGGAAWLAAAEAATTGQPAATFALLGAALLATARDRVGEGVSDVELLAAAGLDRAWTAADLDSDRLATVMGLSALVAQVRRRVGP